MMLAALALACTLAQNDMRDYAVFQVRYTPADAVLLVEGNPIRTAANGNAIVKTPSLAIGSLYEYQFELQWNGYRKAWNVSFEPGKTYTLDLNLEVPGVAESDGTVNFGIDRSKLEQPPRERITLQGRSIDVNQAIRLLDTNKLRLTVIGSKEAIERVRRDLEGPLRELARDFLIQYYEPLNWAVRDVGFKTDGNPTIYVQAPDGRVLHRQDDYKDGADGLRKVLTAIRKPDPNYRPERDPDLRKGGESYLIYIAIAIAILLVLARRT
jgi:hypothetical protein